MSVNIKPDYEKQVMDMNKSLLTKLIIEGVDSYKDIAESFNFTISECVKFAKTGEVHNISNKCFSSVVYLVSTVDGGQDYFNSLDINNINVEVYKKLLFFYEQWKNIHERNMELQREEKDRYARLQAEFENYKKRVHKERTLLESQSKYNTLSGLIDIIDDLELAKKNEPKNEGIQIIFSKLESYLAKQGVEEVDCTGDFNADKHECLTVVNSGADNYNRIVDVVKKGYSINGNIVRYPKVIVSK